MAMDPKWKEGAFCRAVFTEDGVQYEGVIKKVEAEPNGPTALVEFLGYLNLQNVLLVDLLPSKGKEARGKQEEEAKAASASSNGGPVDWQIGDKCRIVDPDNQLEYEGTLMTAEANDEGKYGVVQYVGYGTEVTFWFVDLMPSLGDEARATQEADAEAHFGGATQATEEAAAPESNVVDATLVGLTNGQKTAEVNDETAAPGTNNAAADTTMAVLTNGSNAADATMAVLTNGSNAADATLAVLTSDSNAAAEQTNEEAVVPEAGVADATLSVLTNGARATDLAIEVAVRESESKSQKVGAMGNDVEKNTPGGLNNGKEAASDHLRMQLEAMEKKLQLAEATKEKLQYVCDQRRAVMEDLMKKADKSNNEKKELKEKVKSLESENAGLRKKLEEHQTIEDLRKKLESEISRDGRRSRRISSGVTEEIPRTPPSAQRPPPETRTACWPVPMMMPQAPYPQAPYPGYPHMMYPMYPYMYPGGMPPMPSGNATGQAN